MCRVEISALSISSAGFPEPGRPRTARCTRRGGSMPADRLERIAVDNSRLEALLIKLFGRRQAVVHGHARADQRDHIMRIAPQDLRTADPELLAILVNHGISAARRADVADPF